MARPASLRYRALGGDFKNTYRPRPYAASGGLKNMTWTTPTLIEICIGLEINGYLPAEF